VVKQVRPSGGRRGPQWGRYSTAHGEDCAGAVCDGLQPAGGTPCWIRGVRKKEQQR